MGVELHTLRERMVIIDDRSDKAIIKEWRECLCSNCKQREHWFVVAEGLSPVIAMQAVRAHNNRLTGRVST